MRLIGSAVYKQSNWWQSSRQQSLSRMEQVLCLCFVDNLTKLVGRFFVGKIMHDIYKDFTSLYTHLEADCAILYHIMGC